MLWGFVRMMHVFSVSFLPGVGVSRRNLAGFLGLHKGRGCGVKMICLLFPLVLGYILYGGTVLCA